MCCFLNRRCIQNNCCFGNWNENAWQTNNATAFNNNFANGYGNLPYFYDDNMAYWGYNGYNQYNATNFFNNCCRNTRFFANNFEFDRPVSASFLHTADYHRILEIGFLSQKKDEIFSSPFYF